MRLFFKQRPVCLALALSAALLSACTTTGASFKTSGLNSIVVGQTTMDQAAGFLAARPTDVWQQGDTTLARWGYSATAATDAVYFRQEVWLRVGPDGTFQQMENSINIPPTQHPRTAQASAQSGGGTGDESQAAPDQAADPAQAMPIVVEPGDTGGIKPETVPAPGAATAASAVPPPAVNPLLPPGTQVVPGVTYPVKPS